MVVVVPVNSAGVAPSVSPSGIVHVEATIVSPPDSQADQSTP